jgi:pimeloyl-ACP methyl ester carboxylesterase
LLASPTADVGDRRIRLKPAARPNSAAVGQWRRLTVIVAQTEADTTLPLIVEGARLVVSSRTEPGQNAVIYFGGNAEDVSESIPTLQRAFPDTSLFALHYRGYNGSTGSPSETALIADALLLFDRVRVTYPHIVMIGRSLGSGVAIHVASMRPVERLVRVPMDDGRRTKSTEDPIIGCNPKAACSCIETVGTERRAEPRPRQRWDTPDN